MDALETDLVKLVECPRDAMQGWTEFIPTAKKIEYLQALLEAGFDSLDFGSFVSAKAIPQMADTREVIEQLSMGKSATRLLAIVANVRGAAEATAYEAIRDIGFPFSISETFQQRNTNSSIAESLVTVEKMQEICVKNNKRLVVYISMAFGNPFGDPWTPGLALEYIGKLTERNVPVISLADTVGLATSTQVYQLTQTLIENFPDIESGVHLHSRRKNSVEKLEAAFDAGCRRFDGAINGIGGCPMAGDELVGNMDSLLMINFFKQKKVLPQLNQIALERCSQLADEIFIH